MKTNCRVFASVGLALFAGAGGFAPPTQAGVEIKLPLPPIPPLLFPKLPDPRDLIPFPNVGAFFVPDIDVDIVFRDGHWWTPRDGKWHRSKEYRGPYVLVPLPEVPPWLLGLPPQFRVHYGKEKRIPYGQWKKMHGGGHPGDDQGQGNQGGKGKKKGHGKGD